MYHKKNKYIIRKIIYIYLFKTHHKRNNIILLVFFPFLMEKQQMKNIRCNSKNYRWVIRKIFFTSQDILRKLKHKMQFKKL